MTWYTTVRTVDFEGGPGNFVLAVEEDDDGTFTAIGSSRYAHELQNRTDAPPVDRNNADPAARAWQWIGGGNSYLQPEPATTEPPEEAFARQAYAPDQEREHGRFSGPGSGATKEPRGTTRSTVTSIVDRVAQQGGLTISPVTGQEPTAADGGYIVGRPGGAIIPDAEWNDRESAVNAVDNFLQQHASDFDGSNVMLGLWHDTEHGEVAIDVVEHVMDRDEAIRLGADQDQQAIWDLANETEVATGGSGGREGAVGEAAEADQRDDGRGAPRVRGTDRRRAALGRIERLRAALGTRLIGQADQALDAALERAGAKVLTRARSRLGSARRRRVERIVHSHGPLEPLLAQVGVEEFELLDHAFEGFHRLVVQAFDQYGERARTIAQRAGVDVAQVPQLDVRSEDAADYLVAALTAVARTRLLAGEQAALQAAAPQVVPAARRRNTAKVPRARAQPAGGWDDIMPGLPTPEDLQAASARLVRNAIKIGERAMDYRLPATPDRVPEVATLQQPDLAHGLAVHLEVSPIWQWVHGFYGEPVHAFDAHVDLDGLTTTDRSNDPQFAADSGQWPFIDQYAPGDHSGCTCEWSLESE